MPNIVTVPNLAIDDAITEAFTDACTNDLNHLVVTGSDIAPSGGTLTVTNRFHRVIGLAGNQIQNISHAAPVAGQVVSLYCTNAYLFMQHGGGSGDIRFAGLAGTNWQYMTRIGEILTFIYEASTSTWVLIPQRPWQEYSGASSTSGLAANTLMPVLQADIPAYTIHAWAGHIHAKIKGYALSDATAYNMRFLISLGGVTVLDSGTIGGPLIGSSQSIEWGWEFDMYQVNDNQHVGITSTLNLGANGALTTGRGSATTDPRDLTWGRNSDAPAAVDLTQVQTLLVQVSLSQASIGGREFVVNFNHVQAMG